MNINTALTKLNLLLPLVERQASLDMESKNAHKNILHQISVRGFPPANINKSILVKLKKNDLVVLDELNANVLGAYPFSLRETAHKIYNKNIELYAMCALDAVAIAPVFSLQINITSHCHVTNEVINIYQHKNELINTSPGDDIHIGIHWQSAKTCAADNLCMEMVFLKNSTIAGKWQQDKNYSIFPLSTAIDFATEYFRPLLEE